MTTRYRYACDDCGHKYDKWSARCPRCGSWPRKGKPNLATPEPVNTSSISAEVADTAVPGDPVTGVHLVDLWQPESTPIAVNDVDVSEEATRIKTNIEALDSVLGGGVVVGSVILLSGEPGAGKSTLLMQMIAATGQREGNKLYATGEESIQQVAMRAHRLNALSDTIQIVYENNLESVLWHRAKLQAKLLIIDSIQKLSSSKISGVPGSNTQIIYCINALIELAKVEGVSVIIISQINKDGRTSGSMQLEHGGDVTLHIEEHPDHGRPYRKLSTNKNRFGDTQYQGVLEMGPNGLTTVHPDELPDPEEAEEQLLPFTQELLYRYLELGGEIDGALLNHKDRRLDYTPRSNP